MFQNDKTSMECAVCKPSQICWLQMTLAKALRQEKIGEEKAAPAGAGKPFHNSIRLAGKNLHRLGRDMKYKLY